MNVFLLLDVERVLKEREKQTCPSGLLCETAEKVDPYISQFIEGRITKVEKEETLHEKILSYIKRLNNRNFYKKNGELNATNFCIYAHIDKSTWSELTKGKIVPKKKTLLKLVIALHLNEDEAVDLMRRGSNGFDPKDRRDQIILALIDLKCYDSSEVYEVLEVYREKDGSSFENIYGAP